MDDRNVSRDAPEEFGENPVDPECERWALSLEMDEYPTAAPPAPNPLIVVAHTAGRIVDGALRFGKDMVDAFFQGCESAVAQSEAVIESRIPEAVHAAEVAAVAGVVPAVESVVVRELEVMAERLIAPDAAHDPAPAPAPFTPKPE